MGNSCGSCHSCCPASSSPQRTHLEEGFQKMNADIIDASQLTPLIEHIEDLLSRIKAVEQSPASTNTSHGRSPGISESFEPKFTSTIMEKVSSELERVVGKNKLQILCCPQSMDQILCCPHSMDASMTKEEIRRVAEHVVDAAGRLHWVAVGFSVVAFVLERIRQESSNFKECIRLLERMIQLAKDLQTLNESMPREAENIKKYVKTIVEGATLCCCAMLRGKFSRLAVADALKANLSEIRREIDDMCNDLAIRISTITYKEIPHRILPSQKDLARDVESAVGIDDQVARVTKLLEMEGSRPARAVIIYGIGGSGKSTLGKAVVSRLNLTDYKLSVVKIPDKPDICRLQKIIIFDLGGENVELTDDDQGRRQLGDVLKKQSSFIFVDNVVDKAHIRDLLPRHLFDENPRKVSEGNIRLRILVTSRQSNVKKELNISFAEYLIDGLSSEIAKEFLCKSICQGHDMLAHGTQEYELVQIGKIAEACCSIPLLLEVFTKQLKDNRSREAYEEAFAAIQKGLNSGPYKEENLSGILLYVYKRMNADAKHAFLDICAYFHAWNRTVVSFIVGESQLKVLEEAALVKSDLSGKVIVHDVLREMGNMEEEGTRLKSHEDLKRVLEGDRRKLENVTGISLLDNESMFTLQAEDLNAMKNSLRVLVLGHRIKIHGQCEPTFKKLRLLWIADPHPFPFSDASNLKHLAFLSDHSMGSLKWPKLPQTLEFIKVASPSNMFAPPPNIKWTNTRELKKLKKFKFQNFKLRDFPKKFVLPTSIEELDLSGSIELRKLPKGCRHLPNLKQLSLQECRNLIALPDQLFSKSSSLKSLSMSRCESLTELHENFGQLSLLEDLDLSYCGNLRELPQGFGQLSSVQILRLKNCQSLRELPDLEMMACSLKELDISGCKGLERLPEGFGKLSLLQSLDLVDLKCLIVLPESIGRMSSLTELKLCRCHSLTSLPCSFGNLTSLKILVISDCAKLSSLPTEIIQLRSLKEMTLQYCESLVELPGRFGGISLERLWISTCQSLSKLPNGFGQLKSLVFLRILNCVNLECLPLDFEESSSLRYLDLEGCTMLESETMNKVLKLEGLCVVDIRGCDKLREQWKQMRGGKEYALVVLEIEEESACEREVHRAVGVRLMEERCRLIDCSGHSLVSPDVIQPSTTVGFLFVRSDSTSEEFRSPTGHKDGVKIISFEEAGLYSSISINGAQNNPPEGFHAIPSIDIKSRTLLTLLFRAFKTHLSILYVDVRCDEEGRKYFHVDKHARTETSTSEKEGDTDEDASSEEPQDSTNFGKARRINTIRQFIDQLEIKGMKYFIAQDGTQVKVGDKLNAVFIHEANTFGIFILLKLYADLQRSFPDFQVVWMPGPKGWTGSLGEYERGRACMPWPTLPNPTSPIAGLQSNSGAILFDDEEGMIQGEDLKLVLRNGAEAYPFTKAKLEEMKGKESSSLQHQSGMEFVLGECSLLNSSGEKVTKESLRGKVALLYAGCRDMQFESKLNRMIGKLKEMHAEKFEIVYIGCNHPHHYYYNLNDKAMRHLHMPEEMPWLRLSDMPTFWCRYGSLDYGSNSHLEQHSNWPIIRRLLSRLNCNRRLDKHSGKFIPYGEKHSASVLVMFDGDGMVLTGTGKEVVESLIKNDSLDNEEEETTRKEMIESMRTGYFTAKTENKFRDEITHPMHPEHPLIQWNPYYRPRICNICRRLANSGSSNSDMAYVCVFCDWDLCGACSAKLIQQRK